MVVLSDDNIEIGIPDSVIKSRDTTKSVKHRINFTSSVKGLP